MKLIPCHLREKSDTGNTFKAIKISADTIESICPYPASDGSLMSKIRFISATDEVYQESPDFFDAYSDNA